ncbi:hypothetical protein AK830_g10266 [Neonectria ditissima]|uniref:Uncharacterized protein n=1 Tax=Neonectria ditissima TaxID=78410 RepID=A0A0P7ATK6_9HYPO|nr:hypothetical protein AK830_g10266 [Neonectria ditissima]
MEAKTTPKSKSPPGTDRHVHGCLSIALPAPWPPSHPAMGSLAADGSRSNGARVRRREQTRNVDDRDARQRQPVGCLRWRCDDSLLATTAVLSAFSPMSWNTNVAVAAGTVSLAVIPSHSSMIRPHPIPIPIPVTSQPVTKSSLILVCPSRPVTKLEKPSP